MQIQHGLIQPLDLFDQRRKVLVLLLARPSVSEDDQYAIPITSVFRELLLRPRHVLLKPIPHLRGFRRGIHNAHAHKQDILVKKCKVTHDILRIIDLQRVIPMFHELPQIHIPILQRTFRLLLAPARRPILIPGYDQHRHRTLLEHRRRSFESVLLALTLFVPVGISEVYDELSAGGLERFQFAGKLFGVGEIERFVRQDVEVDVPLSGGCYAGGDALSGMIANVRQHSDQNHEDHE
mmetsp:Transcript_23818/g.38637  ORF Transcript_23818/g.38637 Transcript_23818/m.38637 type:complete len:237 (+) Transcript_23818:309-1019(+)